MISEAAKSTRILDIYNMLLRGQAVHKKELAEKYQVNSKSIQRDLESIRDFLSEQYVKCGVRQNVEYDRANDEYRLVTQEVSYDLRRRSSRQYQICDACSPGEPLQRKQGVYV